MADRTHVPGRACQLCKYKVEIVQLTLNTSVWPIPPLNKQPLRPLTRTNAFQYLVYGSRGSRTILIIFLSEAVLSNMFMFQPKIKMTCH